VKKISTSSKHISLPKQFSEGELTEWFQKYEICCNTNDWDDTLKAKKLPTLYVRRQGARSLVGVKYRREG